MEKQLSEHEKELIEMASDLRQAEKKVRDFKQEIETLIHHAEQDTLTYSVLEHARRMIFKP